MSERSKTSDEKKSRSWPLWLGGIGSVIWLLIVIAYALSVGNDGERRVWEFWYSPPNNFGDTLAGAFAPLAFLWLVVATLLQKHELEQNREALLLQAEELRASVEQLTIQAQIMRDEQARSIEVARANSYESKVVRWALAYHSIVISTKNCGITKAGSDPQVVHPVFGPTPELLLSLLDVRLTNELCRQIDAQLEALFNNLSSDGLQFVGDFYALDGALNKLAEFGADGQRLVSDAISEPSELPIVTIRLLGVEGILCRVLITHYTKPSRRHGLG